MHLRIKQGNLVQVSVFTYFKYNHINGGESDWNQQVIQQLLLLLLLLFFFIY